MKENSPHLEFGRQGMPGFCGIGNSQGVKRAICWCFFCLWVLPFGLTGG